MAQNGVGRGKAAVGDDAAYIRGELEARGEQDARRAHRHAHQIQRMVKPQHLRKVCDPREHIVALPRAEGDEAAAGRAVRTLRAEQQIVALFVQELRIGGKVVLRARAVAVEEQDRAHGALTRQKIGSEPLFVVAHHAQRLPFLPRDPVRPGKDLICKVGIGRALQCLARERARMALRRAGVAQLAKPRAGKDRCGGGQNFCGCFHALFLPSFAQNRNVSGQTHPAHSTRIK